MTPQKHTLPFFTAPRSRLLATGAAFAVVAAAWAAISLQAGWRVRQRTQNVPLNPMLKPYSNPYPQKQNGFRFAAVFPAQKPKTPTNAFWKLWRHSPTEFWDEWWSVCPTAIIELPPQTPTSFFFYAATARASNGNTFTLEGLSSFGDGTGKDYLGIELPWPGVPADYKWIDLTLSDPANKNGPKETWRIYDLAPLRHAVLPTTPLHSSETTQNIPVQVRAWWDAKTEPPIAKTVAASHTDSHALPVVVEVRAVVPPTAFARPSQSWDAQITSVTSEWDDPARTVSFEKGGPSGITDAPTNGYAPRATRGTSPVLAVTRLAVAPHPSAQHVARVEAKLTQYDCLTETITFRNVPLAPEGNAWRVADSGATLTTPLGVQVRLTPQKAPSGPISLGLNSVLFQVVVSPDGNFPASPLQKRVGARTPLRVTWEVPNNKNLSGSRWGSDKGDMKNVWLQYHQPINHPVLPFLTVVVTQEAETKIIPLTFTVPIQAGKPTPIWIY